MIEVIEPGALTSVQTAGGRPGWRHVGVPVGGAADAWSARLANRLVGNADDAALLELTLTGPSLRFEAKTSVALTGAAFDATLDGLPLPPFVGRRVRRGSVLRIGMGDGARGYLRVAGGIRVPAVLGSMATDLRTGFGGHEGRALRAGDRLEVGSPSASIRRWTGRDAEWPDPDRAGPAPSAAGPGCLRRADVDRRGRGRPHGRAPRRAAARRRTARGRLDGDRDRGDPGASRRPADRDAGRSPGHRRLPGAGVRHPSRCRSRCGAADRRSA